MLKRISKLQALRLVSQIMFLISMPELFALIFNQLIKVYSMAIKGNLGAISIWPELLAIVITFIITIVLGRFFCGWLCTFGAMNDFIYIISKKVFRTKFKVSKKVDSILKYLKYVLLVFIIVNIWTNGSKSFDSYSPWDTFAQVYNISGAITIHTGGFILLVIIAFGAVFIERFFCRYFCPLGAILAILSKARILKIKKFRDKCGSCKICTNNCSIGIKLYQMDKVSSGECINCFKCIYVCPRKNAQLNILGETVNPLLPSAITIAAFTGVNALGSVMNDVMIKNLANNTATNSSDISKPEQKKYKDGTYVGIGAGENPNLKVSVKVSNGKISSVEILSANEADGKEALKVIPKEIVDAQSVNVDAISGATMTSGGIMTAVKDALSQAEVTSSATVSEDSNQEEYKDGVYTGVGEGKNSNLKVLVKVNNGKISSIKILSANEPNGEEALKIIPKEIIDEQSTDVDVVSGATMTSNGIMMAVDDALSQAEINDNGQNKYKNGTYIGVGQGKNPGLKVSVTINNDKISSIEFLADDEPNGKEAFGIITKKIIDAQSASVDAVSGATMTSNGVMMAVNDALNQAKINN
jgi:NosR/NirI family nitrous oxide reductase transcriptional regulator